MMNDAHVQEDVDPTSEIPLNIHKAQQQQDGKEHDIDISQAEDENVPLNAHEQSTGIEDGGNGEGGIDVSPFARSPAFARSFVYSIFSGIVVGFAALGFLNVIKQIPKQWYVKDGYPDDYSTVKYFSGEYWWFAVTAGTGLIVGLSKFIFKLPLLPDVIVKEIKEEHVDWKKGFLTFILGMISISGGASLGPEAPLGACGGALATLVCEDILHLPEEEVHVNVLTGFASSFGGLFPNPLTAVLLIIELGNPPKHFMSMLTLQAMSALISFAILYSLSDETFLGPPGQVAPSDLQYSFKAYDMGISALIGMVSAFIGLIAIVFVAIFKKIGTRIASIKGFEHLAVLVLPVLAGIIYGGIGIISPLTLGDGSDQIGPIVAFGGDEFPVGLVIGTLFLKMLTLAVCTGFGLYGGFVFPLLLMGAIVGTLTHHWIGGIPLALAVTSGMIAVPCAFCPLPLTLTVVVASIFENGLYSSVPVIVSGLSAHLVIVGLGILSRLQAPRKSD
eukprot:TRINITY_DN16454_c0_g1_i1.p1 TRINITY_DN16454_c0_g1~~TRINITY_DN16454_c0_g1_i1.p1  ORF type:complete len:503 (-),score=143.50 TRINITY_DN16454_c0_g1_i1:57-1565(-)